MTLPSEQLIRSARAAAAEWADASTPFIFEEWYVAALVAELGEQPLARKLLGRDVVLFRTAAGHIVALEDRCAHRSFPLSMGTVDGESIVCGYHGIRYNATGQVIEVPSQPRCPSQLGVRHFPLQVTGPLVWIWMGAPETADPARVPCRPWMSGSADWVTKAGHMALKASYVSLHENLLDLTHLSYLHAKSFGTPDYARAPYDVNVDASVPRFTLVRHVVPTRLPPIWAQSTGLHHDQAARIATSEFISPGFHETSVRFYDASLPEAQRIDYVAKAAHLPTPETATSTHYFLVDGRCFAKEDASITDFMHEQLLNAFREDVVGLEAVQRRLDARGDNPDFFEFSVASDRASIEMRKHLKRRVDAEQQAAPGLPGPPA